MALLLLIVIGASLGWLASIIARTEGASDVLRQIAISVVASLLAGLLSNHTSLLGGLSPLALGSAVLASLAVLGLYHVVLRDRMKT